MQVTDGTPSITADTLMVPLWRRNPGTATSKLW